MPAFHSVYEFDLRTNERRRVFHNLRFPSRLVLDNELRIRLVHEEADDGSIVYYRLRRRRARQRQFGSSPRLQTVADRRLAQFDVRQSRLARVYARLG